MTVRRRALAAALGLTAVEAAVVSWRRGSLLGFRTEVVCRQGHRFTTTWIPGVSLTSIRLGPWRLMRCPEGRHWSIVTPVRSERPAP
jgi:hypothetical protein